MAMVSENMDQCQFCAIGLFCMMVYCRSRIAKYTIPVIVSATPSFAAIFFQPVASEKFARTRHEDLLTSLYFFGCSSPGSSRIMPIAKSVDEVPVLKTYALTLASFDPAPGMLSHDVYIVAHKQDLRQVPICE